jgi:hypothetical protein
MDTFAESLGDAEHIWESMWGAYLYMDNETLEQHIASGANADFIRTELTLDLRMQFVHNALSSRHLVGNAKAIYETDINNAARVLTLTHRSSGELYYNIIKNTANVFKAYTQLIPVWNCLKIQYIWV